MKSLTDFHYWFIYVFFNKGPSKKWTIKRKKRNLNFISTVFKSICNISKIASIYTSILCIVQPIPSLERGSSPWNDCYAWKKDIPFQLLLASYEFFSNIFINLLKKIWEIQFVNFPSGFVGIFEIRKQIWF